ncbi:MAG: hypothetical protein QHH74_12555 [Spirochaetota bacterium]|nr:hypothetical protein [Spirochaetota bacterium]
MKNKLTLYFFFLFILSASCLFAQSSSNMQTNFSISPPPLGYPEYPQESSFSNTMNFTGAYISADQFSMVGMFLGWVPRYGGDWGAIEGMLGMFIMNGEIDTGFGKQSLNFVGFDMTPAFELPIVNQESFKFIFFGGYDLMLMTTSFTTTDPYSSGTMTWTLTTVMYGPVLGMQIHIGFADTFIFSPFLMMKSMQGSTDITTDPAYVGMQASYDIPSTTMISYGFDIIETTSGVTLSGLINMAGKTNETAGYNSYIFGVSIKL